MGYKVTSHLLDSGIFSSSELLSGGKEPAVHRLHFQWEQQQVTSFKTSIISLLVGEQHVSPF